MGRVVFALQGCLQLALPSTQLIAAAWLAACPAHPAPWHGALPVGEGNGTAGWGSSSAFSPLGPQAPPHCRPLSLSG